MAEESTVEDGEAQETDAENQAAEEAQANEETQESKEDSKESKESKSEQTQESERESESKETDWRSSIEDPKLREFANRFDSPADVAKTALEFRQKLSNAISLPGKKATDEEIAEFNKKLGVPESPDDYEIKLPEDLPEGVDEERLNESMGEFRTKMHEAGARPEQVQAVVDWYFGTINTALAQQDAAAEESYAEAEATLRKEWGEDHDANVEHAKRAAKQFGDEDFQEMIQTATLDGKPVGNHPAFLKAFAKIGRRIGEGGLQIAMGEDEKQSTQQKMDDLTSEAHDAMNRGDRKKADRLFKERDDIAQKFYGQE